MTESCLYVVGIDIGNPGDITHRAAETLRLVQGLICEEYKNGARLLKSLDIKLPLYTLNEHSTDLEIRELFDDLFVKNSGAYALVSDAGTPAFADPGAEMVKLCRDHSIPVHSVPGVSSLMTALMISGKRHERFLYYGFLAANHEQRQKELNVIKNSQAVDYVFLEAPYRLKSMVADMCKVLGNKRKVRLFYKLTYPEETVICTNLGDLLLKAESLPKGEFVLILEK